MPMINIEDAYILDETGAQVDQVTGLYFKNENASDTEKAQARANIGAGGTNPNLLDNAYFAGGGSQLGDEVFPINQRGQTQYTAAGFVFDRWFKSGGVTATLDAGGLTIANSNGWPDGINQRFPMHFFAQMNGEAITASVLYADGSVDSGTVVIDATQNYQWIKYPDAGEIGFQLKNFQDGAAYDYFDYISFGAGANSTPKKIKAFKLEKGTVSTLANDLPPDFGEELRKCQWYLWVQDFPLNNVIAHGVSLDATGVAFDIVTPAQMRSTPTVSYSGGFVFVGNGGYTTMTGLIGVSAPHANHITLSCAGTVSAYTEYSLVPSPSTGRLVFSAEL